MKDLVKRLENAPEFDEELTEEEATELGISFTTAPNDKISILKPLSKTMKNHIQNDATMLESLIEIVQKKLDSGDIRSSMTVKKAMNILDPTGNSTSFKPNEINQMIQKQVLLLNKRKEYLDTKLEDSGRKEVDLDDLFGGMKQAIKASTLDEMESAPELSEQQVKELEDRISNRVARNLKNTLLTKRTSEAVYGGMPCPYAQAASNAVQQGQEFVQEKPSSPDMSEYIRKDSIPCWNCSLPN
jgi:hypothetical protein